MAKTPDDMDTKITAIKRNIIEQYEFVNNDINLNDTSTKQKHWIWWYFPTLKEGDNDTQDTKSVIVNKPDFIEGLFKTDDTLGDHMSLWTKILNKICDKLVKNKDKGNNFSKYFPDADIVRIRSFIYIFLHAYQLYLIDVPEFRNAIIRLKRFDTEFDTEIKKLYALNYLPKYILYDKKADNKTNLFLTCKTIINEIQQHVKNKFSDDKDKQYYWCRELIEQYNLVCDYTNITSEDINKILFNTFHIYNGISSSSPYTDIYNTLTDIKLSVDTKINQPDKTIYALSDIHADIQAFIISLRDCAKVIDKDNYDHREADPYLKYMLEKDLNIEEEQYDMSLGYRWIKPNTYVVICGDILDGARVRNGLFGKFILDNVENDHPQLEIKLLMFINELNRQAIEMGSRIFKIMGNHDLENIMGESNFIQNYVSKTTFSQKKYYKDISRDTIFTIDTIGFYILTKYNLYLGLVINDTLFVHGNTQYSDAQILEKYAKFNSEANNNTSNLEYVKNIYYDLHIKVNFIIFFMNTLYGDNTWQTLLNVGNRPYDFIEKIFNNTITKEDIENEGIKNEEIDKLLNIILKDTLIKHNTLQKDQKIKFILDKLRESFYTWDTLWSRVHTPDNISKRNNNPDWCTKIRSQLTTLGIDRLIVGHCPQSNYNRQDYTNLKTLSKLVMEDAVSMRYTAPIEQGYADGSNIGRIAGITGECVTESLNDFLVYHVDIASSRAFDSSSLPTENVTGNKRNLEIMGRTPQVLEIIGTKDSTKVSVIKSNEINTRIHQPRKDWEQKLGKLEIEKIKLEFIKFTGVGTDTDFSDIKYYDKYVKDKKVVLTNGANPDINCAGSGTTGALNKIFGTDKFCIKENMTNIYKPANILFANKQNIDINKDNLTINDSKYPLGSVFYEENKNSSKHQLSKNINGCYHIRGYNIDNKTDLEKEFSPIVKEYYGAILEDFAKEKRALVLHLAQVPGHIYGATTITRDAMLSAIKNFKNKYEKDIKTVFRFTVIIDSEKAPYDTIKLDDSKPIIKPLPLPLPLPEQLPLPKTIIKPELTSDIYSTNILILKHIYQMLLHHMLKYEYYCTKHGIVSSVQINYDTILQKMNALTTTSGGRTDIYDTYIKNKHNYEKLSKLFFYEIYKTNKSLYEKLFDV